MDKSSETFSHVEQQVNNLLPELIRIRRHLHQHPELSFQEFQTSAYVSERLTEMGIIKQETLAETGIVALIEGRNPEKFCVALRADMDALPIEEANTISYCSQNKGVMHACGHDVHTTCLLGAATILNGLKDKFEGTIKLIFQPGEEKCPGGASLMIKAGAMKNPSPSAIFGLHVDPSLQRGTVGFRSGQYMASTDELHIRIIGKSGHAALPHLAVDPISISALIITALQQIVSRKANPLIPTVLTFGKISGGTATNIIPEEVQILGTLRTLDETWRAEAKDLIRETVQNIAQANGAKAEIKIPPGYPSVFNHPELTQLARKASIQKLGKENVLALDKRMTAEDFSFYGLECPACFYRLGTNLNNEKFTHSLHNAHFDVDESAIAIGVQMMSLLALKALSYY